MGTATGIISKANRAVTAAATVSGNEVVLVDASTAAVTITGPAAGTARRWGVKKTDATTNAVTISYLNSAGSVVTLILVSQDDAKTFEPLGTGYVAVAADRSRVGDDLRYVGLAKVANIPSGNLTAFFGDSITAYGEKYPNYAALFSMGQIRLSFLDSHSGYMSAQLAPLTSEITSLSPKPANCVVLMGTNDAQGGVAVSTFYTNLMTVINALLAAGITPILCTIPPLGGSGYRARGLAINQQIKKTALINRLSLIDFYALLADTTTGAYKAGYDSGDGIHPSFSAQAAMGQLVATTLSPKLIPWSPSLAVDANDPNNLFTNAMFFTDANVDGIPDGWSANAGTGVTYSLVSDATIQGKWARIAIAGAAAQKQLAQRKSGGFAAGDLLSFSYLLRSSGLAASSANFWAYVIWWQDGGGTVIRADTLQAPSQPISKGLAYFELTAPAGATQFSLQFNPGTGDGTYDVAQPTAYNLTALGIQ